MPIRSKPISMTIGDGENASHWIADDSGVFKPAPNELRPLMSYGEYRERVLPGVVHDGSHEDCSPCSFHRVGKATESVTKALTDAGEAAKNLASNLQWLAEIDS